MTLSLSTHFDQHPNLPPAPYSLPPQKILRLRNAAIFPRSSGISTMRHLHTFLLSPERRGQWQHRLSHPRYPRSACEFHQCNCVMATTTTGGFNSKYLNWWMSYMGIWLSMCSENRHQLASKKGTTKAAIFLDQRSCYLRDFPFSLSLDALQVSRAPLPVNIRYSWKCHLLDWCLCLRLQ